MNNPNTTCEECGKSDRTAITMHLDARKKVRFRVDCSRCGVFSHYLENNAISEAVERYLKENSNGKDGVAVPTKKQKVKLASEDGRTDIPF